MMGIVTGGVGQMMSHTKNIVLIMGSIREIHRSQKDGLGTEVSCRKEARKAQKGRVGTARLIQENLPLVAADVNRNGQSLLTSAATIS